MQTRAGCCVFLVALLLTSSAHALLADSTIFLVRHAEKAEAGSGNPNDPELSEAGSARAASLATVLKDVKIKTVYATEFKRTQGTARPTAQAAGIEVTVLSGKETAALVAKLKKAKSNVLVVGHSNTVPEIIKALGVKGAVTIADADYDNLFVIVSGSPRRLIRLHYR